MAYVSFDHAPSVGATSRLNIPRLAWGRIAVVSFSLAFWVGLALVIQAIL